MDDPSPVANICHECGQRKPDLPGLPKRRPQRAKADIIREVCDALSVRPSDLFGQRRTKAIAHARQALMAAFRDAGYSYPLIGEILGRDHSTIIHGVKAHRRRQDSAQ